MKLDPTASTGLRLIGLFVVVLSMSAASTSALANDIVNGDFSAGLDSWVAYIADPPGPSNTISVVSDGGNPVLQMSVNALDDPPTDWHVNTWQAGGPLNGVLGATTYTLSFRAKASVERTMKLDFYQFESGQMYQYLGLKLDLTIGTSWRTYSINFRPEAQVPNFDAKFGMSVGHALGTVWVDDISLSPATEMTFAGADLPLFTFEPEESWLSKSIQNAVIRPDVVPSDPAHVHLGTAALKLAAGPSGQHYAERQANLDLTAPNWEMTFWVYVENPANVASLSVALQSGSDSQPIMKWWTQAGLAAGWNQVVVPKSQFYGLFWRDSGFSWSGAWDVGIEMETNANGPASVWIDDLHIEPAAPDRRPPVISAVNLDSLGATAVTVAWTTDENATSRLDCGTSTGYGSTVSDGALSVSHSLTLTNLLPNTLYHCQVSSDDAGARTGRSGDLLFRTDPLTPYVPVNPGKFQVGLYGVPGWDDTGYFNLGFLRDSLLTRFTHFYGSSMRWETDPQLLAYLDVLGAHGQRAFVGNSDQEITNCDLNTIRNRVNALKAHTALAGWYLYDEPEYYSVTQQQLEAAYTAIKDVDTQHPVTFAAPGFGPAYPFLGAMDYGILDPYPIPYGPPDSILANLDQAQATGKKFDLTVQAYQVDLSGHWPGDAPGPSRYPSRDEMRVMAYLSLNHGAGNLLFYGYWESHIFPGTSREWVQLNDVANELGRLGPIYASSDCPQITLQSTDNANLDVGLKQYRAKVYATVVNRSASPASGTLTFAGRPIQSIKEAVTQQPVAGTSTAFTDTLPGYGVNVYELTPAGTTTPSDPSCLSAAAVSATQVNLSWTDNSSNEDGFRVRRATSAGGPFSELLPAPGPEQTTFTDTTVSLGTQYWYRVTAYSSASGESGATATGPVATPPRAPTSLSAAPGGSNLVILTWTDNSTVETGFTVERATPLACSYSYTVVGTAPARTGTGSTTFSDSNAVVDGTQYWYRVTAAKSGFPSSGYAFAVSAVTPIKAPTSLTGTALTGRVNRLRWTDNSASETGFDVQRAVKTGSTCGAYATIGTAPTSAGTGVTVTYNDVGSGGNPPIAGTTYCYRVRSTNALSQSPWVGPEWIKTKN